MGDNATNLRLKLMVDKHCFCCLLL